MSSSDLQRAAHLARRAGFGANAEELQQMTDAGIDHSLQSLLNASSTAEDQKADDFLQSMVDADREGKMRPPMLKGWWLYRMAVTRAPLIEKMTVFWHGHFATSLSKVNQPELMLQQNRFLRENALGSWRTILQGVLRDPAMIVWLDNNQNFKAHPNENLSRELMELFTLGIGHYSETDVKEGARALTGWTQAQGGFLFNAGQHDNGAKSYLGRSGAWDGDDVIDAILQQPAAAEFLSRKLFTYFAYEAPAPSTVTRLAAVFRKSDYSVKTLVESIFRSPEFWSSKAVGTQVKSPVQLVAGTIRALGLQWALEPDTGSMMEDMAPARKRGLYVYFVNTLKQMGQDLFYPPNVKGWDGNEAWINSATMLERINFASRAAQAAAPRLGQVGLLASLAGQTDPEAALDVILQNLGPLELSPTSRAVLLRSFGPTAVTAAARPRYQQFGQAKAALSLAMQTPQYQLC